MDINRPTHTNSLQTYQVVLYDHALHPEFFDLKTRRVDHIPDFEFESWLMEGSHVLRFEGHGLCISELVTDRERNLPNSGVLTAFLCAGEHDYDHAFDEAQVNYITSAQTETLEESLYLSTLEELQSFGQEGEAMIHHWNDEVGPCMSMLDMQLYNHEMHIQAYHLLANQGLVLRVQTIFECGKLSSLG